MTTQEKDLNSQDPNTNDIAHRILRDVPLETSVKADAWDSFWETSNPKAFARQIAHLDIPLPVKTALLNAKKSLMPSQQEQISNAISQLSKLDSGKLSLAEKHPNVLKHLVNAATAQHAESESAELESSAKPAAEPESDVLEKLHEKAVPQESEA